MTTLEKIKIWCKLKPQRQVRIYSLLARVEKNMQRAGLSKVAEQLDDILSWDLLPDDIQGNVASILRQICRPEKLPTVLDREIRMTLSAIHSIRRKVLHIAPVDCIGHGKADAKIRLFWKSDGSDGNFSVDAGPPGKVNRQSFCGRRIS